MTIPTTIDEFLSDLTSFVAVNHAGKSVEGYDKRRERDDVEQEKALAAIEQLVLERVIGGNVGHSESCGWQAGGQIPCDCGANANNYRVEEQRQALKQLMGGKK